METTDIDKLTEGGTQLLFSDTVQDDLKVSGAVLRTCRFVRIGAKKAKFNSCSLTQCQFEDSYLRKADFTDVDLTGSTFRNCNLEKATFKGCILRYCTFQSTHLDRDEIIGCLPVEPNLRRDLARNLRRNFEELGDKVAADVFLNLEIDAHEQELLGGFRRKTDYYKTHYTGVDQAVAGLKLLGSKLSGITWGYGHRVRRLLISYLTLTLFLSIVTYFIGLEFTEGTTESARALGFWESVYCTFAGTLGLGTAPLIPSSAVAKALQVGEGFVGTLFLALLAAAAYRRISR